MADIQAVRRPHPSGSPQYRPRTRQRIHKPAPVLDVPDINEDAAERKRVLNVLAQRRYRQRRRQKRAVVARQVDDSTSDESRANDVVSSVTVGYTQTAPLETTQPHDLPVNLPTSQEECPFPDLDVPASWPNGSVSSNLLDSPLATNDIPSPAEIHTFTNPEISTTVSGSLMNQNVDIDPMLLFSFSSTCSSSTQAVAEAPTNYTFPDSYLLPVPELKLLQAFMRLATSLKCRSSLWDLSAISPFNDPSITFNPAVLTSSFAPTLKQRITPHHPIIDFLPWPSVRDRLIGIFSLPDDYRPPCAVGPLALVQLAYDMEDSAEGIRIWGHSPCNGSMWEIGQVLFQRWWFVFDRQVIEQSNRWRLLRGAPELCLGNQPRTEKVLP